MTPAPTSRQGRHRRVADRASGAGRRLRRALGGALLAAGVLSASACFDDGGPGAWTATLEGPAPVGAALVEVRGEGITGFEGAGDARVFPDPAGAREGAQRLIVVSASGLAAFQVRVEDVSGPAPTVTLVSAAGTDDRPLDAVGDVRVRVAR